MIFGVKNLGPLKEAQVDLSKRLIVLAGPNSSGKTYLAWSVYGLFRTRDAGTLPEERLTPLVNTLLEKSELDLREFLRQYGQEFATLRAERCAGSLHRIFATDPARFVDAELSLRLDETDDASDTRAFTIILAAYGIAGSMHGQVRKPTASFLFSRKVTPAEGTSSLVSLSSLSPDESATIRWNDVFARLVNDVLFGTTIIFPAERIATSIFAKELSLRRFDLVDDLLDLEAGRAGSAESIPERVQEAAQRYPWPIRDSLRVAADLEHRSRFESDWFMDLADEIEETVMGGKVKVGEYGQLAFSPTGAPELELGVHVTASVVKSLSSLVFYFRHQAKPGDFLIIDEPELNLHPDNQRKIARILAKAVNRGFKIMISSHSDYLMRELNNLIMLSQPSEKATQLRERLGYDEDCLLRPEQLGVYLFKDGQSRTVEVSETGFSIETIDNEINRLNEVTQDIYADLFMGDDLDQ